MASTDIIIVGGGISGLYFAHKLIKTPNPPKIHLIESTNRLGGLILTIYDKDGSQYEAGAGRFNKYHKKLISLIKYYKIEISEIKNKSKVFRPIHLSSYTDFDKDLKTVLDYSKKISTKTLQQITFEELCIRILGHEKTRLMIASFGYNAEFQIANAYTSLALFREDFNGNTPYYVCVDGFSELISRLENDLLSNGVIIHKNVLVKDISVHKNNKTVILELKNGNIMKTDQLVLAIPKKSLLNFTFFDKSLLESVESINLNRIYAKYAKSVNISRTTTDLELRQIIPINNEKGLVMVSYSDLSYADFWETYTKTEINRQLKLVFPDIIFPKMNWIRSYFWKDAVHCWRAGINPTKIRKAIENIHPNLHIIGESYSMRQGWIEGALETADRVYKRLSYIYR